MKVWVNSVLSVLFFNPSDIPDKAAFVSGFRDRTKVFDGDPMILPIGNAPPNVPRIAMKSRDGSHVCEVGLDRLSFAYNDTKNRRAAIDTIYPEYRQTLDRVVQAALAGISSPIQRLGFVTRHIVETGPGASGWFRSVYLHSDRVPEAFEAHLNLLHRFEMEAFHVNRWLKIRTLRDQQNPDVDPAVGVEIDINTIPEKGGVFDRSTVMAFYLEGFDRAEKDLQEYVLDFASEEG